MKYEIQCNRCRNYTSSTTRGWCAFCNAESERLRLINAHASRIARDPTMPNWAGATARAIARMAMDGDPRRAYVHAKEAIARDDEEVEAWRVKDGRGEPRV